jgi:hypothetical protein
MKGAIDYERGRFGKFITRIIRLINPYYGYAYIDPDIFIWKEKYDASPDDYELKKLTEDIVKKYEVKKQG